MGGKFIIPFDSDGSIGKDYGFSGKILGASINLTKEFIIKDGVLIFLKNPNDLTNILKLCLQEELFLSMIPFMILD